MRCRNNRFTLLEVLLSLAVLMVLLAVLSLTFRSVTLSWRNAGRDTARVERMAKMGFFADNLLRNIERVTVPWGNIDGVRHNTELYFYGMEDALTACATGRVSSEEQPGVVFFDLRLSDSGELVLRYLPSPFPLADWAVDDTALLDAPYEEILAEGVSGFKLSFAASGMHEINWHSPWERDELPLAVLLEIEWENGERDAVLRRIGNGGGGI